MDCFYLVAAAMDNTSGVVTMTEVARALRRTANIFGEPAILAFTARIRLRLAASNTSGRMRDELDHTQFVLSMIACSKKAQPKGWR